ncbi:MAG: hypothetical protein ACTSRD_08355 [Promethearchaeota archaeon]
MNKKLKILTFLLLGFLLVSSIGLVAADSGDEYEDDDDHDEVDDEFEHEEERQIEIEYESDKVEITSKSKNKGVEDKFEIEIKFEDYVEVKVGFSTETEYYVNGTEVEEESEFEFSVKFKEIVEYIDLNNNSILDSGDDEVQVYEFDSFKPIEYSTEMLPSNNTLHKLIISTADDVFKVHVFVVEEFDIVNGSLVTPMEAKIDLEFTNFNYLEAESQLALYIKLESEYEYEYEEKTHNEEEGWSENHEEGYSTHLAGENGFFTWDDFALVDDVEMPIEFTPIADDDDDPEEDKIYFNYARGDHIYHDPKIGFAVLSAVSPTNWLTIGLITGGAVVAVATVALIVFGARKRR